MNLIVLLGDVEARFSPFGDSINLDTSLVHGLHRTRNRLGSHFGCTRWNSKATWVKWKLILLHLEIVLTSMQHRCMVCAKRTIGQKSVWMDLMVLLGDVGEVEACLSLFGDSVNLEAR